MWSCSVDIVIITVDRAERRCMFAGTRHKGMAAA